MTITLMDVKKVVDDQATIIRVDPRYPGIWQKLAPYLQQALDHDRGGDWLLEDVHAKAERHQVQLWALVNQTTDTVFGALVTGESVYDRRKVLDILLLGTDPHSEELWFPCLDQLKLLAKQGGASCLQGTGRPGWAKKLGADRIRTIFEIDL